MIVVGLEPTWTAHSRMPKARRNLLASSYTAVVSQTLASWRRHSRHYGLRACRGSTHIPSLFFRIHAREMADVALKHRLPAIYGDAGGFVEASGLMFYGESIPDNWRRSARYVDRILKGAKPADLPVEQPAKFELVINRASRQS
jgi:putative ABC transport system substrate-binding protein